MLTTPSAGRCRRVQESQLKIELANGSRILCLPGEEATIRGFSPNLLVIDEASRVPDDLYRAVRPMLAVSQGRLWKSIDQNQTDPLPRREREREREKRSAPAKSV